MATVLERCRVAPPEGTVAEQSLPLTFFDLPWINFPHVQRLLFYKTPHSKTHFIETLIPNLKDSLSLTLKNFFPLVGNLIIRPDSIRPEIRYVNGDSVSLTIAECSTDFNYLTGNYPRNTGEFYPFVPQMPPAVTHMSDTVVAPLLALQLTLFPNFGICLGITYCHAAADDSSLSHFLKSWSSIAKSGGHDHGGFTDNGSLPFYDRVVGEDPNGIETILWSQIRKIKHYDGQFQYPDIMNKVRATFIMSQSNVQRLKNLVSTRRPTLSHISSFSVICGYIWVCIVKSRAAMDLVTNEDELEPFICMADCRNRFEPPIPETYFGNCITACFVTAKNRQLVGEEGFLNAAELIGEAIRKRAQNGEEVLKQLEAVILKNEMGEKEERVVGVAGSSKLGFYGLDFGWGKPIKTEIISIDVTGAIALSECRDSEGDLEVGLSFPKTQMDAFSTIFINGLGIL